MLKFMADFETTTKIEDCRVWGGCIVDIELNEVQVVTNNIDDFMEFVRDCVRYDSVVMYFHNLKFDGEFILHWLLNNGFHYNEQLNEKKSFKTLITDTNAFYSIEIKWGKGKKAKKLTIYDSLKIIPLPVRSIAKAFGLSMSKGDIDYTMERPIGWQITKEERSYIERDCLIVAGALKMMFDQGLDKMTLGGNAIFNYKDIIGKDRFKFTFPVLDSEIDSFVRKSYKGGYVYVNPKFQGTILNTLGRTYDVNSLYPSRMYYDLLPYGEPVHFKGKYTENTNYPLYIQRIVCKFKIKPNHIPTIQLKGNSRYSDTEYITYSGKEPTELTLTNIDLEIFLRHYEVKNLKYIEGYMFRGANNMFKGYIDHWNGVKVQATKEGNKGQRQIAKLMLNNLYGKFGQSPNGNLKIPTLNEDGIVSRETIEGEPRKTIYTPMASFITAYARRETQVAFQENIERCCYCDTDSIHLVGDDEPKIDIDDTRLGAWKCEGSWNKAVFIRAKTYIENMITDEHSNAIEPYMLIKCAGMPDRIKEKVTFENFKPGFSSKGKLTPKRVKGGVVLIEGTYTMK